MRELTVKKNDAGQRLDKFLQKALRTMPLSLMYKYIRLKKIKLNGARTQQNVMLSEGDVVRLYIAEEFFGGGSADNALSSVKPNLDIVYEDGNILLLNKRAGVLVHDDSEGESNSLLLHIKAYLYQKGEYNPEEEQSFSVSLCNRIDRNTGGIVIAAKNAAALRMIDEKIRAGELTKKYLCLVHGVPEKKSDTLTAYLRKDEKNNIVRIYEKGREPRGAKEIITKYKTLASRGGVSLLEVELLTGRTHQIRAQFAFIGHPLVGDGKYGVNKDDRRAGYKYQALYSYYLKFNFPTDAGELNYLRGKEFKIPEKDIWFAEEFYNG